MDKSCLDLWTTHHFKIGTCSELYKELSWRVKSGIPESGRVIRPPSLVTVDQTTVSLSTLAGSSHPPDEPDLFTSRALFLRFPLVDDEDADDGSPGSRRRVLTILSRVRWSPDDTELLGLSEGLPPPMWPRDPAAILVRSGATINSGTKSAEKYQHTHLVYIWCHYLTFGLFYILAIISAVIWVKGTTWPHCT